LPPNGNGGVVPGGWPPRTTTTALAPLVRKVAKSQRENKCKDDTLGLIDYFIGELFELRAKVELGQDVYVGPRRAARKPRRK
jgi:hypothetical protein